MSLINNGERLYDPFTGKNITPSTVLFSQAERRIKDKKTAIEDLQNELNLLKRQAFEAYLTNVRYDYFSKGLMYKAQSWLSMLKKGEDKDGNKLDKRKKYEEKACFEYIQSIIGKYLGIENIKIDEIIEYNFGEGMEFIFNYQNHTWMLSVPIVDNVKMRSYETYGGNCFQLRLLFYTSPSCATTIGCTFEEDNLKNIMQQGIEKYCNKENENEQKTG